MLHHIKHDEYSMYTHKAQGAGVRAMQSKSTRCLLRCAVPCCAVLCCAVLYCAVLCCAVLCCAHLELGDEEFQVVPAQTVTEGRHQQCKLACLLLQVPHLPPLNTVLLCYVVVRYLQCNKADLRCAQKLVKLPFFFSFFDLPTPAACQDKCNYQHVTKFDIVCCVSLQLQTRSVLVKHWPAVKKTTLIVACIALQFVCRHASYHYTLIKMMFKSYIPMCFATVLERQLLLL